MTLQATGAVSFSQINTELLKSPTAQIALNDSLVRGLFGVTSGAIGINNGYGKQYRIWANITISANTANYSLTSTVVNTFLGSGYVAGITDTIITINSDVYIYSSSTATPSFSISSFTSGDTVKIINNGTIIGAGGAGGTGANYGGTGGDGGIGGTALYSRFATSVQNNGAVYAGGGGGGGSGWLSRVVSNGKGSQTNTYAGGGGGGGGGYDAGTGGIGGTGGNQGSGDIGSNGTLSAGGAGGGNQGFIGAGDGGAPGADGTTGQYTNPGAAGLAGYYIDGSSYVTWLTLGTIAGRTV
jgi:hypothetical protein